LRFLFATDDEGRQQQRRYREISEQASAF